MVVFSGYFYTIHFAAIDPAILRRAAYLEEFRRPDDREREEIFVMDCNGLGLGAGCHQGTGPSNWSKGATYKLAFTFSDIRTRLLPEALCIGGVSKPQDYCG